MADTAGRYPIFTLDVIARCAVDAKREAIVVPERSGTRVELPLVSSGKQCGYEAQIQRLLELTFYGNRVL